jgi:hypothetical protein
MKHSLFPPFHFYQTVLGSYEANHLHYLGLPQSNGYLPTQKQKIMQSTFSVCKLNFLENNFYQKNLTISNWIRTGHTTLRYFMSIQKHTKNWLSGSEQYQVLPSKKHRIQF